MKIFTEERRQELVKLFDKVTSAVEQLAEDDQSLPSVTVLLQSTEGTTVLTAGVTNKEMFLALGNVITNLSAGGAADKKAVLEFFGHVLDVVRDTPGEGGGE